MAFHSADGLLLLFSWLDSFGSPYFFFARRALRAFDFCIFAARLALLLRSPLMKVSNLSLSNLRAMPLFCSRDRVCWHYFTLVSMNIIQGIQWWFTWTMIPVGICFNSTQLTRLLIACPPGPDPLMNFSTRSWSSSTIFCRSFLTGSVDIHRCSGLDKNGRVRVSNKVNMELNGRRERKQVYKWLRNRVLWYVWHSHGASALNDLLFWCDIMCIEGRVLHWNDLLD